MNGLNRVLLLLIIAVVILGVVVFCFIRPAKDNQAPLQSPEQTVETSAEPLPVETTEGIIATTEPTQVPTETEPTAEPTTEPTTEPIITEPPEDYLGIQAAHKAVEQLGKPYQYGTAGPDTFDASGLLQYCYKVYGVALPRSTKGQSEFGTFVEKENLRPGDAVFFWTSEPGKPEFVGIYVGNNKVVAACNSSKPVCELDITISYYVEHYVFARRFY